MCKHDAQVSTLKPDTAVKEIHASRRDDQRYDHRRNQDCHDRPAKGYVLLAEADCGQCAEADRQQGRGWRDLDRVPDRALPSRACEEVAVVFQGIAFGIEAEHFRGEGEEILSVEAEWYDHQNRRNQEHQDGPADNAKGEMPQDLTRGQVGGDFGTVTTFVQPKTEPGEEPAKDRTEHQGRNAP